MKVALMAFAALLLSSCESSSLDSTRTYCEFTPNHTLCKFKKGQPAEKCGTVLHLGMTNEEKEMVMQLHNEKRMKVANGLETRGDPGPQSSAANMMEMTWDTEMELMAQTWAERCISDHDCPNCRRSKRFRVGQNLYQFGHFSGSWKRSVDGWYDEVADFNRSHIFPFYAVPGLLIGHYTQMLWAQTSHIGCGKIFHHPKNSRFANQLYICNYGLAGNLIRSEMYKDGKPCSDCPLGTQCSLRYPGLCSGTPTSPLTVRPPVFPWEVKGGFPTRSPLVVINQTTLVVGGKKPLRPGPPLGPDAIIKEEFIEAPTVIEDGEDKCEYSCQHDLGCSVKILTNRLVHGFVNGYCFPASYGEACHGTPTGCSQCKNICRGNAGYKLTFRLKDPGNKPKKERLTSSGSNVNGNGDKCLYNCEKNGGCSVKLQTTSAVNGNVLGSCFSEAFGGKCSGTPKGCGRCLLKCQGKDGQQFAEPRS